jgi:hypothetical protein
MTIARRTLLVSGLAIACGDDLEGADAYMDDDVPSGNCMTDTGECDTDSSPFDEGDDDGPTTAANDDECSASLDCDAGLACMATFDGDIGEFECSASCIADMDETLWCLDDAACCGVESSCGPRGYCTPAGGLDESSTGESSTSDASTDEGGATTSGTGG